MIVEVSREIEQLVSEIRSRPEQRAIEVFASNRANEPFHKGMEQGNIGDGFSLGHLQYSQIGLPLPKPIKGIMVGAEVLWHRALPSNGAVELPAKSDTIDGSGMDAEPDDPAGVFIHDDEDPVGPQGGRFAPEQIDTPEAVLDVAQEGQPGWTAGVLFRRIVMGENPSNHVFVDWDVESQGDLLQGLATQYFSFDGEAAPLVIGKQDAFVTKLLFEYLVLDAKVIEDFLLMPVDPAGEDEEQQLPRLQNRLHISPDAVQKVEASGINHWLSTALRSDHAVCRRIVDIGTYGSAEFIDHTPASPVSCLISPDTECRPQSGVGIYPPMASGS